METKHTPGPWTVAESPPSLYPAKHLTVQPSVAIVQHPDEDSHAAANARLIAAAPELLADGMTMAGVEIVAGRLVCDSCGSQIAEGGGCGCEIDERDPVTHERRARLRATIAKATGETL